MFSHKVADSSKKRFGNDSSCTVKSLTKFYVRYHCKEAGKEKFLFASEEEASDFINRYSDAMMKSNGYAPVRSYRCDCCKGFHTTSQPLAPDRYRNSRPVVQMSDGQYSMNLRHVKHTLTRVGNLLNKAYKALAERRLQDTRSLCLECVNLLDSLDSLPGAMEHRSKLLAKLNNCVERWKKENAKLQKAMFRVEFRTNNFWSKPWYVLNPVV